MKVNEFLNEQRYFIESDFKRLGETSDNKKKINLLESISFWVMTVRKVKKSYDILYENDLLTKTTHLKYEDMFQDFFTETYKTRYDCYQVLFDLKKYGFDIENIKF